MKTAGISPRTLLQLVREARDGPRPSGPILVDGPLASHLARSLAEGGEPGLVVTARDPAAAACFVCVLGGAPKPEQLALLRRAARAGTPTVAVQTGDAQPHVPYVLAEDVVDCTPGQGFPVEEIAAAIVRGLGREAAALAALLPVLRPAAQRRLTLQAAGLAAGVAAAPWSSGAHLPVLVPLQARLLRDLDVTAGRPQPELGVSVGPELGGALAAGIAGRRLVRGLPFRGPLVRAAVAAGLTTGLAAAATRLRT
jgi:uncharacterized protein (DUF697 family)